MTWDDQQADPGRELVRYFAPRNRKRTMRVAIVPADYADYPFVVTLPKGSPISSAILGRTCAASDDPAVTRPTSTTSLRPSNHGHTIHEYWMEQSRGKIGVTVVGLRPLPNAEALLPVRRAARRPTCRSTRRPTTPPRASSTRCGAPTSATRSRCQFDLVVRMYAGYDETVGLAGVRRDEVPDQGRHPARVGQSRTRRSRAGCASATCRGRAGWPASGRGAMRAVDDHARARAQTRSRHEIAHAVFCIGDNNNNPYITPYRRTSVGPWDMMDRGSFNGPGRSAQPLRASAERRRIDVGGTDAAPATAVRLRRLEPGADAQPRWPREVRHRGRAT